MADILYKRKI